jgi:hypothetical protein
MDASEARPANSAFPAEALDNPKCYNRNKAFLCEMGKPCIVEGRNVCFPVSTATTAAPGNQEYAPTNSTTAATPTAVRALT